MTGRIQLFLKKFVQTALAHVESTRQILHTDFFQKMLIQIADDLIGLIGFDLNKFVGIFQGIVNDFYQKTGGCTTGIGFRKLPIGTADAKEKQELWNTIQDKALEECWEYPLTYTNFVMVSQKNVTGLDGSSVVPEFIDYLSIHVD